MGHESPLGEWGDRMLANIFAVLVNAHRAAGADPTDPATLVPESWLPEPDARTRLRRLRDKLFGWAMVRGGTSENGQ